MKNDMSFGDALNIFRNIEYGYSDKDKIRAIKTIVNNHTDITAYKSRHYNRIHLFRVIKYLIGKVGE